MAFIKCQYTDDYLLTFKVYKPKRYLVVGRRNDFECDEWIEIKSDYTDVEIVTYDDLVDTRV